MSPSSDHTDTAFQIGFVSLCNSFVFFFLIAFAVHVSVYMGLHVLWSVYGGVPWSTYGGQRSTCKSQFSFSTTGSSVLARVIIGLEQ